MNTSTTKNIGPFVQPSIKVSQAAQRGNQRGNRGRWLGFSALFLVMGFVVALAAWDLGPLGSGDALAQQSPLDHYQVYRLDNGLTQW